MRSIYKKVFKPVARSIYKVAATALDGVLLFANGDYATFADGSNIEFS